MSGNGFDQWVQLTDLHTEEDTTAHARHNFDGVPQRHQNPGRRGEREYALGDQLHRMAGIGLEVLEKQGRSCTMYVFSGSKEYDRVPAKRGCVVWHEETRSGRVC